MWSYFQRFGFCKNAGDTVLINQWAHSDSVFEASVTSDAGVNFYFTLPGAIINPLDAGTLLTDRLPL